jgi:uncharacterized protein YdcH (DUF465 family)
MSVGEAQEVRAQLLQRDAHYRELAERHHQLDDRLHELTVKSYLSDAEQFEEIRIKKHKLKLKDEMEQMARDFAQRGRYS